jgi:hypothetical protein
LIAALALAGAGGCVRDSTVHCDDGRICPAGTVCVDDPDACLFANELGQCDDLVDGTPCTIAGTAGICVTQDCVHEGCGDGFISSVEDCESDADVAITCESLGYYEGTTIHCSDACRLDLSECAGSCGDGDVNGPEYCEGLDAPAGSSCLDFGYDIGELACAVCAPDLGDCRRLAWVPRGPGVANDLYDAWFAPDGVLFAVGDGGLVARLDGVWSLEDVPTTVAFHSVWGSSSSDVYAVGDEGVIAHLAGTTWTVTTVAANYFTDVWGSGPGDVWAVAAEGGIWHDDGTGWALDTNVGAGLAAITGLAADDIIAVGSTGGIYRYDGADWTADSGLPAFLNFFDVWMASDSEIWAVGSSAAVYRWDGNQWSQIVSPTALFQIILAITGSAPDDLYVATYGGVHHWDGKRWRQQPPPADGALNSITSAGADRIVAVGPGGVVVESRGSVMYAPIAQPARALWATADDDVLATGGGVFHFDGSTWTDLDVGSLGEFDDIMRTSDGWIFATSTGFYWHNTQNWNSDAAGGFAMHGIWALDSTHAYAAGFNDPLLGAVYEWDGVVWDQVYSTDAGLLDVWGFSTSDIHAVGHGATAHFDGAAWTTTPAPVTSALRAVWGAAPDDLWAVGDDGVVLHGDGTTWTVSPAPFAGDLFDVWGTAPDDVFVAGDASLGLHWDGTAWTKIRFPAGVHLRSVGGTSRQILFGDSVGNLYRIERNAPW